MQRQWGVLRYVSGTTACWQFRLRSERATRVELWIDSPDGAVHHHCSLNRDGDCWQSELPESVVLPGDVAYATYGYRVWGPNWPFDPRWQPGSEIGFLTDCDQNGNRFNPNKLLLDVYAREIMGEPPRRQHH